MSAALTSAASVNAGAAALVARLTAEAETLRVSVSRGALGETLIDAGSETLGSIAAGLKIAEICMGGLGTVELVPGATAPRWPWTIIARSSDPVTACLASQYAGWRLTHGEGKDAYFALASGPARALARKDPIFQVLTYRDTAATATLVIEGARPPPSPVVEQVAQACGVAPEQLTIIYAPTQSLAGTTQIVARALEVALHTAHELKVPLDPIVDGMGAPAGAAASDLRYRHGPHQRRHRVWRPRPPLRHRRRPATACAGQRIAERGFARLCRPFAEIFGREG